MKAFVPRFLIADGLRWITARSLFYNVVQKSSDYVQNAVTPSNQVPSFWVDCFQQLHFLWAQS